MSESSSQPRTSLLMLSQYKWQVFDIGLAWWSVGTKNKPKPKLKAATQGLFLKEAIMQAVSALNNEGSLFLLLRSVCSACSSDVPQCSRQKPVPDCAAPGASRMQLF